jgi:hypothetical protein
MGMIAVVRRRSQRDGSSWLSCRDFCHDAALRHLFGVVMLWWAFDESYEHSRETGHATRVTVGGSVASCEDWLALDAEWCALLNRFRLAEFHMTDFEANRGPFKGWEKTPERHRDLLAPLLDVIERHLKHFFGVCREVESEGGNETAAYRLCVGDVIAELARYRSPQLNDEFAIVFARRKGFRIDLVRKAIEREGADKFGPITSDRPINNCALQVADIIAYETRCIQRDRQERYPFRRLRDMARAGGGSFSLTWH